MKFADYQDDWAGGLVTNMQADQIPANAYSDARNLQLRNIGGGKAILGTRPGITVHNSTRISAHAILGMTEYRRYSSGAFTNYHVGNTAEGKFKLFATNGTVSDASSTATPFTAGTYFPDYAQANNLLFIVNGQENKKYNGTLIQAVGGADPSAPTVADSGVAGNPNGTYDFAIAYYNSATGYETSRSGYNSVTVASKKIDVTWTTPSDSQFDYIRVYIRLGTLSGNFYRLTVASTPSPNATHEGHASGVTTTRVDITDAQFTALTTLAPTTTENDPPPVLDKIEFHQDRLFGVAPADPSVVLFSKLSTDTSGVEAFDPNNYIPVGLDDGDRITALFSANETQLIIFKSKNIYALEGIYPDWEIRTVSQRVGATSHQSVVVHNKLVYFWSHHGPAMTDGQTVDLLAQPDCANIVDEDAIEFTLLGNIAGGFDDTGHRIIWAIPEEGESSRNTLILPYNLQVGKIESLYWEILDICSIATARDGDDVPRLFFGDYKGRTWKLAHTTFNDGVASGTTTGHPTGSTASTLTDSGASFLTTGTGLAELYLIVKDQDGENTQRARILSNTSTVLTLDGNLLDPLPDSTWTYYVGAIDTFFRFGYKDGQGTPMKKKRLDYLIMDIVAPETETQVDLCVRSSYGVKEFEFETSAEGAIWDSSMWDAATWGGASLETQHFRHRIGLVARKYAADIKVCSADASLAVTRVMVNGRFLTEKT